MHIHVIRLWPRRPPDGAPPLGLCCDAEGLSLGPSSPLIRHMTDDDGRPLFRARSLFEINAVLSVGYGREIDASPFYRKLEQIAECMTDGEWTKASLAALHLRLPALPDRLALARLEEAEAILKVWVPDLHPRWPAHSEDEHGGRFRPQDQSESPIVPVQGKAKAFNNLIRGLSDALRNRPPSPRPLPRGEMPMPRLSGTKLSPKEDPSPPGIGHNGPPEPIEPEPAPSEINPEEVPQLPATRPSSPYAYGREVASALEAAVTAGNEALAFAIARAADAADWLVAQYDNIVSYLDPPKSYEELSANAQISGPHPGYEDHHIVEQGRQNDYLDQDQVQSPANVVRIPYYRHKDVQSYYQTPNPNLGGLTPRQYLRGKSYEEHSNSACKRFAIWES